jgi:voltage-gated potassium channel
VTASVAAMFVGSQERKVERDILNDMHAQMGALHAEITSLRMDIRKLQGEPTPTGDSEAPQRTEAH